MILLFLGLLLWSGVHYVPSLMPAFRAQLVEKFGSAYRGLFAACIIASIVLMVLGWQSMEPEVIYDPISDAVAVTSSLMLVSLYLFAAAHGPSNIKRFIRHPMLCGVIVWGAAHLIANGDSRSILLFGGMIIWAAVEMWAINNRDKDYEIPEPAPIIKDVIKIVAALVVYTGLVFGHPYFTGMPVM